ncbi:MAG: glycosyltransferase 87 family protein [Acidobacteriota bacterium]
MSETHLPAAKKKPDVAELAAALACALGVAITSLFLAVLPLIHHLAVSRDFVVYWATGQQLVHHGNPYDATDMGQTEHGAGFEGKGVYYMRNPPWSLPLALPLGLASARVSALPWSLLMLAILIGCVRMLWRMFGSPGTHLEWLGYCFPPALLCIISGQTAIFLLLGLVLFLRFYATHPFRAGAALWFCTLKPHLFLPFAVVLLLWIVVTRSYRILVGAVAAIAASCALTELLDPQAWSQYLHWARNSGISHEFIPCLSVMLRDTINPAAHWLVFVPAIAGGVWAVAYFWPRRRAWDWLEHGNLVVLVSIFVAPYCWLWDHSVAIPALLYGVARIASRKMIAVLALLFVVLELLPFIFQVGLNSKLFLWPALAWVVWYAAARAPSPVPARELVGSES